MAMASPQWSRKTRSTLSWQHLSVGNPDTGERWTIIWDTKRNPDGRSNTAVEKFESGALDRARHMLRMGFIVYEIREPSGAVFLEEAAIKQRLGLRSTGTTAPPSTFHDSTGAP